MAPLNAMATAHASSAGAICRNCAARAVVSSSTPVDRSFPDLSIHDLQERHAGCSSDFELLLIVLASLVSDRMPSPSTENPDFTRGGTVPEGRTTGISTGPGVGCTATGSRPP